MVDNASTDGTGEWLAELAEHERCVLFRALPTNIGGAGGFRPGCIGRTTWAPSWPG